MSRRATPSGHPARRPRGDAGGVVVGWAAKLLIVFLVVGVPVIDGVRVVATHLTEADDASAAAESASKAWQETHDAAAALRGAEQAVPSGEAVVPATFKTYPDGSVYVQVRRTVPTILFGHIGPLKHLAVVTESATATDQTS